MLIIFLIVLLLAAIGIGIYVAVMASRVNRDTTDTTSYIQQPSAAPTWEVIDDDKITNILLFGADTVSYTHLDVYKRQVFVIRRNYHKACAAVTVAVEIHKLAGIGYEERTGS